MSLLEELSVPIQDTLDVFQLKERSIKAPQEVINAIGEPKFDQNPREALSLALLRIELLIRQNDLYTAELELNELLLNKLIASTIEASPDVSLIIDDLLIDLHYANSGRFLEMVHKKLNLVNNCKASTEERAKVHKKLLELILLEGPEFLKGKILSHIEAAFNIDHHISTDPTGSNDGDLAQAVLKIISPESKVLFSKIIRRQPVSMNEFQNFLKVSTYREPQEVIYSNYLQNNISFLSKYYDSMSFDGLRLLFAVPISTDLEVLVAQMIAGQKLPMGTLIGQEEKIIYFKITPNTATENELARRLRICGLVDQITELIELAVN